MRPPTLSSPGRLAGLATGLIGAFAALVAAAALILPSDPPVTGQNVAGLQPLDAAPTATPEPGVVTASDPLPTPTSAASAADEPTATASPAPVAPAAPVASASPTAVAATAPPPSTSTPVPATTTPLPTDTPLPTSTLPPPTATPVPPTATPVPPAATPPPPVSLTALEQQLFAAHNAIRAEHSLPPLALNGAVTAVAQARAADMAANGYFGHTSPSGETAFTLMNEAGIGYLIAGENIAYGTHAASELIAAVMDAFMASGGHRANILEPRFDQVGVGIAQAASGTRYVSVMFIDAP